jgi:zona occludens toxin (predicted ATPase)
LSVAVRALVRATAPSAVWRAPELRGLLTAAIRVEFLIAVIALALLMVVILVISAPLRAGGSASREESSESTEPRGPAGEGLDEHETGHGAPARERIEWDAIAPAERRAELEAAREAKYREIRDTELDYRTGKLSQEDFAATDGALRAEAVEILDWLDALDEDEDDS